ncbi:Echinoderm microtubule-associated protein-like CG42247, partial [Araneus ventricosus]
MNVWCVFIVFIGGIIHSDCPGLTPLGVPSFTSSAEVMENETEPRYYWSKSLLFDRVRSISQLKNEFQDVDTFFLDEYETNDVPQLERRSTYSSKYAKQHSAKSVVSRKVDTTVKSPPLELDWIHGYDGSPLLVLDNSELVYPVGPAIILYRRSSGQQRRYMDHTEDVCSISAHPSGKMVASGQVSSEYQGASVHIWLIESLQTIAVVDQMLGNPVSVAFSAHDFVLLTVEVGSDENSLSFWDWESDALLGRVQLNDEHLSGGEFHPQEADLAVTFGRHHLAFWRRKKDGFLSRTDALAPFTLIDVTKFERLNFPQDLVSPFTSLHFTSIHFSPLHSTPLHSTPLHSTP